MCIEDAAVLTALLSDERVVDGRSIEAALASFDAVRRERGQWLVKSSRFNANVYQRQAPGVGDNFANIEAHINERNGIVANVNVADMCDKARQELARRLEPC